MGRAPAQASEGSSAQGGGGQGVEGAGDRLDAAAEDELDEAPAVVALCPLETGEVLPAALRRDDEGESQLPVEGQRGHGPGHSPAVSFKSFAGTR